MRMDGMLAGAKTLKARGRVSIFGGVRRARLVSVALSVALLGVTGCGGDSGSAPAPSEPSAPPAAAAPATSGGATPVSDTGSGGASDGGIAKDIETERVAAKRALRTWGQGAERACKKAERRIDPWVKRVLALKPRKGERVSPAEARRIGKRIAEFGRAAEYEYKLLQNVALPQEAAAIDKIEDFFDKEEEALMLVQRLGVELQALNDLEAFVTTIGRLNRLDDDYRRAGRAVGAHSCVDND
jgi:hypothetical protein